MARSYKPTEAPVYALDAFSRKAHDSAFYIEKLETHLRDHKFISKPHKHDFYLLLYITSGLALSEWKKGKATRLFSIACIL